MIGNQHSVGGKSRFLQKIRPHYRQVIPLKKGWRFFAKHGVQMSEVSADLDFTIAEEIALP